MRVGWIVQCVCGGLKIGLGGVVVQGPDFIKVRTTVHEMDKPSYVPGRLKSYSGCQYQWY